MVHTCFVVFLACTATEARGLACILLNAAVRLLQLHQRCGTTVPLLLSSAEFCMAPTTCKRSKLTSFD